MMFTARQLAERICKLMGTSERDPLSGWMYGTPNAYYVWVDDLGDLLVESGILTAEEVTALSMAPEEKKTP